MLILQSSVCRRSCAVNAEGYPLQVIGCMKGVLATFLSVLIFGNSVSSFGAIGYAVTVIGVLTYGWSKIRSLR